MLIDVLQRLDRPFESMPHDLKVADLQPKHFPVESLQHGTSEAAKIAHALTVLQTLASLVGELRSSHLTGVKVAAALAGAIKLAQHNAIDVEDVFAVARNALRTGSIKLSAADDPGEIVGSTAADAETGGPRIAGYSYPEEGLDELTATLRSIRRA
jgi:hypothetical protein